MIQHSSKSLGMPNTLWHQFITEWNISGNEMPGSIMASAVVMPYRDACHGQPPALMLPDSSCCKDTTVSYTQQQLHYKMFLISS